MKAKYFITDIDGTIKLPGQEISTEILKGFNSIHKKGIISSVITGRGVKRLFEGLGSLYNTIINSSAIGVENGGRIASSEGKQNLFYFQLSKTDVLTTLDIAKKLGVEFLAYYPKDISRDSILWSSEDHNANHLRSKFKAFNVTTCDIGILENQILKDEPCMLSIKPKDIKFRDYFPEYIKPQISSNEGYIDINSKGIDKGSAIKLMSNLEAIHLNSVFFAGNDENDLAAYSIPINHGIFVGNNSLPLPESIVRIADPAALARYLQDYELN